MSSQVLRHADGRRRRLSQRDARRRLRGEHRMAWHRSIRALGGGAATAPHLARASSRAPPPHASGVLPSASP
jgi:hypothetical protein